MHISILMQGEAPNHDTAQEELDLFNDSLTGPHKVAMVWNPSRYTYTEGGLTYHVGRWEIWISLGDNTHAAHRRIQSTRDRYIESYGWCRKLQTFCYKDDSGKDIGFAAFDTNLVKSLKQSDAWSNSRLLEEAIEKPEALKEMSRIAQAKDAITGSQEYYRKWDDPIIGSHTGGSWRHRIR